MAVFVSRALAGGDDKVPTGPATATFADVPTDFWAFKYVEYAYTKNVVQGSADGYRPGLPVDHGQMAVFMARAMAGGDAEVPAGPDTPSFPDVTSGAWYYKYVEYCHAQGVAEGDSGGYHPDQLVTRDQMAVYVTRAFHLAE